MKVSFDFDETLDREEIQEYAKELIQKGIEVWICTARTPDEECDWATDWNDDLFEVSDRLGIPRKRVIFTNMWDKFKFLPKEVLWHLEDNSAEIRSMNKFSKVFAIDSLGKFWKEKCEYLLAKWVLLNTVLSYNG